MTERGKFFVIEGGLGAGKTTQLMGLIQTLREAGEEWHVYREPGGTTYGDMVRDAVQGRKTKKIQSTSLCSLVWLQFIKS